MFDSLPTVSASVAVLLTTYLLHSSLLLAGVWVILQFRKNASHVLSDRLWKTAAIGGLVTAPLQLVLSPAQPLVSLPLANIVNPAVEETPVDTFGSPVSEPDTATAENTALQIDDHAISTWLPDLDTDSSRLGSHSYTSKWSVAWTVSEADSRAVYDYKDAAIAPVYEQRVSEREAETSPEAIAESVPSVFDRLRAFFSSQTFPFYICVLFVVLGTARLSYQSVFLGTRLRRCRPLEEGPARNALDELIERSSINRSVGLLVSDSFAEPIACGVLRWRIVLPTNIENELSRDELTALLAHELAHLARHDTLWLGIGRILCSCFAFQPLNLVARRRWQQAAEYLCDDWAVGHAVDRFSLARCLTRVAEWRAGQHVSPGMLAAGGGPSSLSDRVERLVEDSIAHDPWLTRSRTRLLFGLLALLVLAVSFWGPRTTLLTQTIASESADENSDLQLDDDASSDAPMVLRSTLEQELDAVQHDLNALQSDMERLHAAIDGSPLPAQANRISQQLQDQMEQLRARRNQLSRLLVQFEKEFER